VQEVGGGCGGGLWSDDNSDDGRRGLMQEGGRWLALVEGGSTQPKQSRNRGRKKG